MDFKTFKIKIMNRNFSHTDLAIIGIPTILIVIVIFNVLNYGVGY